MAKLRFNSLPAVPFRTDERIKIGHNRTIERDGNEYTFRLHGHPIAVYRTFANGTVALLLDTRGWATTTTRQAMKDALKLFGFRGGVSVAGGRLSASIFRYTNDCQPVDAVADSAIEFFFRNGDATPCNVVTA